MEVSIVARQALLFGHVIFFALALATIVKEDIHLMFASRIDNVSLRSTARLVKWLLLALWITGIPMVMMDVGTDVSLLLGKPKLLTKLMVVAVLTVNGALLHFVVFPLLSGNPRNPNRAATIAATLGAVSTVSWFYAAFAGVARIVAPHFSLQDFLALYFLALSIAVSFAILIIRDRLALMLGSSATSAEPGADGGQLSAAAFQEIAAAFREIDEALKTLVEMQQRPLPQLSAPRARPPFSFGDQSKVGADDIKRIAAA
jgi:hypothetical protein